MSEHTAINGATAEQVQEILPDHPIVSRQDIQYVYGALAALGDGSMSPDDPYKLYQTDVADNRVKGTEEGVVAIRIDLRGETPEYVETVVREYTDELTDKIRHSYYSAPRGMDYSIARLSGKSTSVESMGGYAEKCLTAWPKKDAVADVTETHPDGWMLEALPALAEQEAENEDMETVMDQIQNDIQLTLSGNPPTVITPQFRLPDREGWVWPGEIDVFNEAMKKRRVRKLRSKNDATDAAGTGIDPVSEEETTVYGVAEDPMEYQTSRQRENYPGLDTDESWRKSGVSAETAFLIDKSEAFMEACSVSRFGITMYILPYFQKRMSVEDTETLYQTLRQMQETDSAGKTAIEQLYETAIETMENGGDEPELGMFETDTSVLDIPNAESLRFFITGIKKGNPWTVLFETPEVDGLRPIDLAQAQQDVFKSRVFQDSVTDSGTGFPRVTRRAVLGLDADTTQHPTTKFLLDVDREMVRMITTGDYFRRTFSQQGDDDPASETGDGYIPMDDTRFRCFSTLMAGDGIDVDELLTEYTTRLEQDDGEYFPVYRVISQYAQLAALANAGQLRATRPTQRPLTDTPTYMQTQISDVGEDSDAPADERSQKTATESRKDAFHNFINQHPALSESPERRAVFTLGALVGNLSNYQGGRRGMSRTILDGNRPKNISKQTIKQLVTEAIDAAGKYASVEDVGGVLYAELASELTDTFQTTPISEWRLTTHDIRFHYALGVAYGTAYTTQSDDEKSDSDSESETAQTN